MVVGTRLCPPRDTSGGTVTDSTVSPRDTSGGTVTDSTVSPRDTSGGTVTDSTVSPRDTSGGTVTDSTVSPRDTSGGAVTDWASSALGGGEEKKGDVKRKRELASAAFSGVIMSPACYFVSWGIGRWPGAASIYHYLQLLNEGRTYLISPQ